MSDDWNTLELLHDLHELSRSERSFKEILDEVCSKSVFYDVLKEKHHFFEHWTTSDLLTQEDLDYLFEKLKSHSYAELSEFSGNTSLVTYILRREDFDFKRFVDVYLYHKNPLNAKNVSDHHAYEMFFRHFENFSNSLKDHKITLDFLTPENVQYMFDNITTYKELWMFDDCLQFLHRILSSKFISFKELVDKYCSFSEELDKDEDLDHPLIWLIHKVELFKRLLDPEQTILSSDDLTYFLNKIDNYDVLNKLCNDNNLFLLKYCADNFLFDERSIDTFTKLLRRNGKNHQIFFSYVDRCCSVTQYKNAMKGYEQIYDVYKDPAQRQTLYETVRSSERAKNIFRRILEMEMLNQYSFEQIKELITKDDQKKKLKLNF